MVVEDLMPAEHLKIKPMVFNEHLGEGKLIDKGPEFYPYWIYADDAGNNKLIKKNRIRSKDILARPFFRDSLNSRAAYEVACTVEAKTIINDVQIYFDEAGYVAQIDEYFGKAVGPATGEILSEALDVYGHRRYDPDLTAYNKLIEKYGESFVRGDVYRLFSNYIGDSHLPRNMMECLRGQLELLMPHTKTAEIRWIDYGQCFTAMGRDDDKCIIDYLEAHKNHILKYSLELLKSITAISNKAIDVVAERIYGTETKCVLIQKICDDDEPVCGEMLEDYVEGWKEKFILYTKKRLDIFRQFYDRLRMDSA